jgi:hypothetical protein
VLGPSIVSASNFSQDYHHLINSKEKGNGSYTWFQETQRPFNTLILSWNILRLKAGSFEFYLRVKHVEWSPFFKVAIWGRDKEWGCLQKSLSELSNEYVKIDVDTLFLKNGVLGTAFEVQIKALGCSLEHAKRLHVSTAFTDFFKIQEKLKNLESISLANFPNYSQMTLNHLNANSLCSPTATFAAVCFLNSRDQAILSFVDEVYDQEHRIYGNWVLNIAAAYQALEGKFSCFATRLNSFEHLHQYLSKDLPVVVSIQGPIKGSPLPYKEGHLMVVKGWDNQKREVICMDPAFAEFPVEGIRYEVGEFLKAWARRLNLAYVFTKG